MKKDLASLVGGIVITTGLIANPAYGDHLDCDGMGEWLAKQVIGLQYPEGTNNAWSKGEVSTATVDKCVVDAFNKKIAELPEEKQKYKIEIIYPDEYDGGTVYIVRKKESP